MINCLAKTYIPQLLSVRGILAIAVLPNFAMSSFTTSSCASPDASKYSVAFVTVPNEEVANNLSSQLVTNRLAACVNIIPGVKSVYLWKGEVKKDEELILKIKTKTILVQPVTEFVKKNHPYEVCEVIFLPIIGGNSEYLKWIGETVSENNF